jgi:hypothetical protein
MEQALKALEAQRKRDLEDWMDKNGLDVVAFPAQGDTGLADLEFDIDSTTHSLQNGVKYSHGNRAIRHLGVPTVSVPMGIMSEKKMPVNITFAGKAYEDTKLLEYAYAFESATKRRVPPPLTPALPTDVTAQAFPSPPNDKPITKSITAVVESLDDSVYAENELSLTIRGIFHEPASETLIQVFVDGHEVYNAIVENTEWSFWTAHPVKRPEVLGWSLKPLAKRDLMVVVVVKRHVGDEGIKKQANLLWVPVDKAVEVSVGDFAKPGCL